MTKTVAEQQEEYRARMANELAAGIEAIAQNLQNNLTIEERILLVRAVGKLVSHIVTTAEPGEQS